MLSIILFIISFCFVIISSWFITAILKSNNKENKIIYFLLICSAQIILGFEVLSLFKAINSYNVLIINLVFLGISIILRKMIPDTCPVEKNFYLTFEKIKSALKKDKFLLFLSFFFMFSIIISFYLAVYAPANNWDTMTYHFARIAFWIQHKGFEHYETSSIRQLMFQPNAEILYLWILLFIKKDMLSGILQFLSFCGCLWVLYSFLAYLKLSAQRILWAIFLFASLPAIIIQSSSTQNDLVLGFFLFASLYLFIYSLKGHDKTSLIMSSLAVALAIGVKSSVFMFLPVLCLIYGFISAMFRKEKLYKPLIAYAGLTLLFIFILSSYSYILNYIEFNNIIGLHSYINYYTAQANGIKSSVANLIRYSLTFIDFTGFSGAEILRLPFLILKTILFGIFNIKENQGLTYSDIILLNTSVHENLATFGLLGFLVFLPLSIKYAVRGFIAKSEKIKLIGLCSLITILFTISISYMYGFALWNIRYFVTAIVLSSPVFALNYTKKTTVWKIFIFAVAVFCFVKIPLYNTLRPVIPVDNISILTASRDNVRYETYNQFDNMYRHPVEYLGITAKNYAKIGLILSDADWYYQFFSQNPTWRIFPLRYELLTENKLKNMDYILVLNDMQTVFNLDKSKEFIRYNKIDFNRFRNFKLVYQINTTYGPEKVNPVTFYIYKNK